MSETPSAPNPRRNTVLAIVFGLLGVTFVGLLIRFGGPTPVGQLSTDSRAPEFVLEGLNDEGTVELASMAGEVVVVNFWATWCPPCIHEMPALERLYRAVDGHGVRVLTVSVDHDIESVRRFVSENQLTLPVLLDTGGAVARSYGTVKFPETFVIGPDGKIVEKIVGVQDWGSRAWIERLLALAPEIEG